MRSPDAFHVTLKPRGAICNLDCKYCYFLSKENLYPDSTFRMSEDVLERFTAQYIGAHRVPEVTFSWQGGEPTLMGLDFFRTALEYQEKYCQPGMTIRNTLQTNGTLLNDEWCSFLSQNGFLVGLSIDGPAGLHDAYRVDKGGQPTFAQVMTGLGFLKAHEVATNILCCVHAGNAAKALDIYRFFRDEIHVDFLQFIPIVERVNDTGFQEGEQVTERSVSGRQYGDFLITIFDEWVRQDVGRVFVQIFDIALSVWCGKKPGLCIFEKECGRALALEHTGDVYACDHYVEPGFWLGNISDSPLSDLVASQAQSDFGAAKRETLPQQCLDCEVRFICNGGCPKNRILTTPDGEAGLNYLCEGYRKFFNYIDRPMRVMKGLLEQGQAPAGIMRLMALEDQETQARFRRAGRNDPCPCGSGQKFKHCHGLS